MANATATGEVDIKVNVGASDTEINKLEGSIKVLDGAVNLVGGSIELLAGSLALSGAVSKEQAEEFESLAVGAIAVADGAKRTLDGVVNLKEGLGKLGKESKLAAKASELLGKGIKAATGPVGLIIAGITILTGILFALRDKVEIVGKAFEYLGNLWNSFVEAIGFGATETEKFQAAQAANSKETERALALAKAQGKSTEELIDLERKLLTEKRDALKQGTEEYIDAQNTLAVFNAQVITDQQKREDDANKKASDKRKADAEKEKAEQEKIDADKLKAEEDYLKMLDDIRKRYEAEDAARQVEVSNAIDAILQKRLEAQTQEENAVYDKYFRLQEAAAGNAEALTILEEGLQNELTEIDKKYSDERIALSDIEKDALLKARMALAAGIGDAIGALGALFKEGTAASKTAALAEIAINTALGFTNALDIAQKSAKGTGTAAAFAFPIFYATQIAAVLGAIGAAKNILSKVPGGSGGGSTSKPTSMGAPSGIPTGTSYGAPDLSFGFSGGNQSTAVQAYVVTGDVTTGQQAEAQLRRRRTLGG
tara:strand:+ start:869 stop:2491 length:1623 start_codon:yes stop_codon:yes gene_type:complete